MSSLKIHHLIVLVVAAALGLVVALWTGQLSNNGRHQGATLALERGVSFSAAARDLPEFKLIDQDGAPFTRERFKGQWSLVFFGYTHCPDICPTTLAVLAQAMKPDGALADVAGEVPVRVVFVSVDPQRDDSATLKRYVDYFNPEFIGLTGPEAQIEALTRPLGILHVKADDPNNAQNYLVDHSASVLVINPKGQFQALLSAPHEAPIIARDMRSIVQDYRS